MLSRYALLMSIALGAAGVVIGLVGLLRSNSPVLMAGLAVCIVSLFVVVIALLAESNARGRQR